MPFETPRTPRRRGAVRHGALGLLAAALLLTGCDGPTPWEARKDRERLAKAQAIFAERCKTAGVVIKRTVKDVEGIELKKVRPELVNEEEHYFDPMFEGAAMAGEVSGPHYVWQFLQSEFRNVNSPEQRGQLAPPEPPGTALGHNQMAPTRGYRFVEYLDEASGKRQRCRATIAPDVREFEKLMQCEPVSASAARYVLDYEDLVDPADRALWVAGTKLRVIDKQTGEVIAELTRFVIDPGLGRAGTGRRPWAHVTIRGDQQCPIDPLQPTGKISRYFVDTVLIPKQGD